MSTTVVDLEEELESAPRDAPTVMLRMIARILLAILAEIERR